MIGQTSCNGWRTLDPTIPEMADRRLETQAMMRMTEIVEAANHKHTGFQGLDFAGQGMRSPNKALETLAKSGIEMFDESSIDPACALRFLNEGLDHRIAALHNASRDVQLSIQALLDDLHNGDIGLGNQLRSPQFCLPTWQGSPKCLAKGCHVARQTVYRQQQRAAERQIPDLVRQNLDQIPMRTDRSTQPQTG